jgi:hypothetical protein
MTAAAEVATKSDIFQLIREFGKRKRLIEGFTELLSKRTLS